MCGRIRSPTSPTSSASSRRTPRPESACPTWRTRSPFRWRIWRRLRSRLPGWSSGRFTVSEASACADATRGRSPGERRSGSRSRRRPSPARRFCCSMSPRRCSTWTACVRSVARSTRSGRGRMPCASWSSIASTSSGMRTRSRTRTMTRTDCRDAGWSSVGMDPCSSTAAPTSWMPRPHGGCSRRDAGYRWRSNCSPSRVTAADWMTSGSPHECSRRQDRTTRTAASTHRRRRCAPAD